MATATERLLVRIDATTEQLRRELDAADKKVATTSQKIERYLKNTTSSFEKLAATSVKWGAAMGAATAAATAALVKSGLKSADALAKTADKLGVTTEALARMRFAAEQTGVATNTFDTALQRFTRRLADAAAGSGPAVKAFEALGLSAQELVKLSPDKALAKVADAMNTVENQSQKVSLAFKLFDSEGVDLVNTLALGSEGLAMLAKEADTAGLSLNRIDAAKIEAANDSMNRASKLLAGFGQQLAIKVAPVLEAIADRLFGIAEESGGAAEAADKAFSFMVKAAEWFGKAVDGIKLAWYGMKATFQAVALFIVDRFDGVARVLTETWNKLPFVNKREYKSALSGFRLTMESELKKTQKAMEDLVSTEATGSKIEGFFNDIERKSQFAAIEIVSDQESIQDAVRTTEDITESLSNTTTTTSKQVVESVRGIDDAWSKALEGTVNRIDTVFADAWRGAFDSFKSFSTSIKDAFKSLLAELAHIAITRPIIMNIGAAFGLGSAAAASGGGVFGSSLLGGGGSLLSGGLSSFGSPIAKYFGGLAGRGGILGNLGFNVSGGLTATGGLFGGGAALGGGILAGSSLVGGLISQQLFGGSGIGSTIGGIGGGVGGAALGAILGGTLGGIAGPAGAILGSVLGGGLESALGFGKNNGRNAGIANLNLASGGISARGVGKTFNQGNVDAAQSLAQGLLAFSQAIGGSTGDLEIKIGNRGLFRLNGEKFGDEAELVKAAIEDIIDGADKLTDQLKDLIKGFDGSTDELIIFSQAVISISEMLKFNPVTKAVQDYEKAQKQAVRGLMAAYEDQVRELNIMTLTFDGSAGAASALNTALGATKQLAYDLAIAFQAVSEQIDQATRANINYFKEQTRTQDEQIKFLENQQVFWSGALTSGNVTDPNQILQIAQALSAGNKSIFDLGPQEGRRLNVDTFINFERWLNDQVQQLTGRNLGELESSQNSINNNVNTALTNAASGFENSATKMESASQLFWDAVNRFISGSSGAEIVA